MRKLYVFLLLTLTIIYPQYVENKLVKAVEILSKKAFENKGTLYSKQPIAVTEIKNESKKAKDAMIGQAIGVHIKGVLQQSLIFYLVDRDNINKALKEISLSESGVIGEGSGPEIGKFEGIKYFIGGSVIEEGEIFKVLLQLTEVETLKVVGSISIKYLKSKLIENSKEVNYKYITANGIGLSFGLTPANIFPSMKADTDEKEYSEVSDANGSAQFMLNYRFTRYFKMAIAGSIGSAGIYERKSLPFSQYKNIISRSDITNYPFLRNGQIESNVDPDLSHTWYNTKAQVGSTDLFFYFVLPVRQKFSVSLGLAPGGTMIVYRSYYRGLYLGTDGITREKDYNIEKSIGHFTMATDLQFELFVLPRIALTFGVTYKYLFPNKTFNDLNNIDEEILVNGERYSWHTMYPEPEYVYEAYNFQPFLNPDGDIMTEYDLSHLSIYFLVSLYF